MHGSQQISSQMSVSHPSATWKDTEGGASLMSWKQPGNYNFNLLKGKVLEILSRTIYSTL